MASDESEPWENEPTNDSGDSGASMAVPVLGAVLFSFAIGFTYLRQYDYALAVLSLMTIAVLGTLFSRAIREM